MFIPKHVGIQEIEEDKRPGGEMIQSNISNYGTELFKIEISGKTWGRPISNKGLLKAEMMMMMKGRLGQGELFELPQKSIITAKCLASYIEPVLLEAPYKANLGYFVTIATVGLHLNISKIKNAPVSYFDCQVL